MSLLAIGATRNHSNPDLLSKNLLETIRTGLGELSLTELQQLDLTISRALSVTRSHINEQTPVNSLPPEVLGLIFEQALSWPTFRLDHPSWASYLPHFRDAIVNRICLSHVCRQWRSVALGMASLWSLVEASRGPLADEFLTRSQDVPLQVVIERGKASWPSEEQLIPHRNRISGLVFSLQQSRRPDLLVDAPQYPSLLSELPNLEYLLITNARPPEFRHLPIDSLTLVNMFPNGTPSLKRLYLNDQKWFPNVSYEHLTHLHISHGNSLQLPSFLPLLRRCTHLEELLLNSVSVDSLAVSPSNTASLPRLRLLTLILADNGMHTEDLLPHILFPDSCSLRLLGDQASQDLHLPRFPTLPFTRALTRVLIDYDPHPGPYLAPTACTVKATSGASAGGGGDVPPSSLLLTYNTHAPPSTPMLDPSLLLPLDRIEELTYRTRFSSGVGGEDVAVAVGPLHPLPADAPLPSLKLLRLVDITSLADRDDVDDGEDARVPEGGAHWLARLPPVPELHVWSADTALLALLGDPARTHFPPRTLRKLVFHHVCPPSRRRQRRLDSRSVSVGAAAEDDGRGAEGFEPEPELGRVLDASVLVLREKIPEVEVFADCGRDAPLGVFEQIVHPYIGWPLR